ncbi:MAG: hypothetical protein QM656_16750 [Paracoccaceae bacterium]
MMVKAVILFLCAMAVIAMIANWLMPGRFGLSARRRPALPAAKCPACGRPRIGKGRCPCGKA